MRKELALSTYTFSTGEIAVKTTAGNSLTSSMKNSSEPLKMQIICARKAVASDSAIILDSTIPTLRDSALVQQPLQAAARTAYPEIFALPVVSKLTTILADEVPLLMEHRKSHQGKTFNILIDLVYSKEKDQLMKSSSTRRGGNNAYSTSSSWTNQEPLDPVKLCDAMSRGTSGSGLNVENPVYQFVGKMIGFIVKDLLLGLGNRLSEVLDTVNTRDSTTKSWKLAYYMLSRLPTELEPRTNGFKLALRDNVMKIEKYIKSHVDSSMSSGKVSKLIAVYKKMVCIYKKY